MARGPTCLCAVLVVETVKVHAPMLASEAARLCSRLMPGVSGANSFSYSAQASASCLARDDLMDLASALETPRIRASSSFDIISMSWAGVDVCT